MGWISDRCFKTGTSIGGCKGMTFKDKPLRKIAYRIHISMNIFERDYVRLECGHNVFAAGMNRARCAKCRDNKPKEEEIEPY